MTCALFRMILLLLALAAAGAMVTVDYHQASLTEITALEREKQTYVSAAELFALFSGRPYWSPDKRKLAVTLNGMDLVLTENSPYALAGDSVLNLVSAPFQENGEFFVPAAGIAGALDGLFPDLVTWDAQKKVLKVISSDRVIRRAVCEEKKNGTLYTLFLPDSMGFEYTYFKPQLNINIVNGRVSPLDLVQGKRLGKIKSVEAVQFADNAQVALQLTDDAPEPEVAYRDNPARIEVVVRSMVPTPPVPRDSAPVGGAQAAICSQRIRTIIIDPGHGGRDPGAVNTKEKAGEKEAVLAIALKLVDRLKAALSGTQVLLTRDDDTFIPLIDRSKIANRNNGDLFVSIHANSVKGNAAKRESVAGYGVYFLDVARDDESRAVAALENAAIEYEEKPPEEARNDIDFILKSAELNVYRDQSEQLAIAIEQEMSRIVKDVSRYNTGVNQAGFYVLRGPQMPSVLVETAFISNPREARLLKNAEFQEQIAKALCGGILRFKEKCEKALP
ncbi:MAG: N-acetylmuramoyl-L-alanine amidase [Fibrobacterota bacterium]